MNMETITELSLETINSGGFRVDEYGQFFMGVKNVCKENPVESLVKQVTDFEKSEKRLEKFFKKQDKSNITAELAKQDKRRDSAFACLYGICKANLNHFDANVEKAAQDTINGINSYGKKIYSKNYVTETHIVFNLIEDFEQKLSAQITLLNLEDVAQELKNANIEFNKLYTDRQQETAKNLVIDNAGELIKDTLVYYRELEKHIRAHNIISPSKKLNKLIMNLNAYIIKYNNIIAMRTHQDDENEISN